MDSPFMLCRMYASVGLYPYQFDSNYKLHLKNNLINRLEKKCYKDYGYIDKIYGLLEINNGLVHCDNPLAMAMFNVTFSCKLCKPINNTNIVCQLKKITKELLYGTNGPILIFIQPIDINTKTFSIDSNGNIKKNGIQIIPNTFVIIKIIQNMFYDTDNAITALGKLEDVANDEQITKYYEDLYKEENNQNEIILDEQL